VARRLDFKSKILFVLVLVLVLDFVFDYEHEDDEEDDFISPPAISFVTSTGHL